MVRKEAVGETTRLTPIEFLEPSLAKAMAAKGAANLITFVRVKVVVEWDEPGDPPWADSTPGLTP